jgi:hypothetical protein
LHLLSFGFLVAGGVEFARVASGLRSQPKHADGQRRHAADNAAWGGGWSLASGTAFVTMQAPETATHVAAFDEQASDAAVVVAQAWSIYRGSNLFMRLSPNERAVVVAVALHADEGWTVALLEGSEPTFETRGAQISLIVGSLRPKDYQRESFAGRKALPLTPERIQELRSFVETSMKSWMCRAWGWR